MNRLVVQAACVFALACIPYLNTLHNHFHYDDFHSVVNNHHIRSLGNIADFFIDAERFSVHRENAMYRPLLLVTYAVNYAIGGAQPVGYHLTNILIHAANAVLIYLFLGQLSGNVRLALYSAIFFAVNPLNSEAVNYVSSRSELLMSGFFILTCLAYIRFVKTGEWGWYGLALVSTALALMSKSVAVVLVGIIPLCDWFLEKSVRRRWRCYLPFAALAALYVLIVQQYVGKAIGTPVRPFDVQLWTQLKALVHYVQMGNMPVHLSVEHQFFAAQSPLEMAVLSSVLFILSFVALIVWQGGRHLRFALAWIGLTLLPTLVVPLIVLVNEHRLYLASVAGAWMAGWCIVYMARRRRGVALVVAAVYTIITMSLTWQRNPTWADELNLWSDAAAKGPLMLKPRLRLADALVKQQRLPEAEAAYLAALALRPQHVAARTNLGRLYMQLGRYAQAEEQFFALLAVSPDAVAAQLNLAEIALRQSRWEAAASHYHNVLQYDDTGGVAQGKLGYIASQLGDPATALQYYNAALELVQGRDAVRFSVHRGTVLKQLGRLQEAEMDYRRALKLDPAFVDAWYNLGNLYRDSGHLDRAINAYKRIGQIGTDRELTRRASQQIQNLKPQSHQ